MNLYIIAEDSNTRNKFFKSLDLKRFKEIRYIDVNRKNTIGSYARTTRIMAKEKGAPFRILVVFNAENHALDNELYNLAVAEVEEACLTSKNNRTMRVFGYSSYIHTDIVNKMQKFLDK